MDYLIERMLEAPCTELRVVTRPEKRDVIENARRHGASVVQAYPASLGASLFAGLRDLADDDVALLGFPDAIWQPPVNGYGRILKLLDAGWDVALGLLRAPDMRREEPVIFDDSGKVRRIEFKPERPSSDRTWACAAAHVRTLRALEHEPEPGVYFNRLSAEGRVGAVPLPGMFLDIGTPKGLEVALASL